MIDLTLPPLTPAVPRLSTLSSSTPRLAAIAVALLALTSCSRGPKGRGFAMPPVPVEVSEVQPETMRSQFRALGSIDADETVQIVSELNGTVVRLPFVEGSPIATGALIAQLDDRETAAEAERATAQRSLAQANAERAQKLADDKMISTAELDAARTNLKVAEANDSWARARQSKSRIRAPFAGMVGSRRVSPGAYLKAGDVITEIARVDVMKVRFAAPERLMADLRRGSKVNVTTPAFPSEHFGGEITVVDPIIDPETRTIQLTARVANPRRLLKPGMSGNVAVTLSEHRGALAVPDEAVFAEGTQSFVFLVKPDSTVAKTAVVLGMRDSSRVEVTHGLEAGARVVRTGHQKLYEGARVMPIPAAGMMAGPGSGATPPGAASAPARGAPSGGGRSPSGSTAEAATRPKGTR